MDANGDSRVSSLDALVVINFLSQVDHSAGKHADAFDSLFAQAFSTDEKSDDNDFRHQEDLDFLGNLF